jgi:hypothetical protein
MKTLKQWALAVSKALPTLGLMALICINGLGQNTSSTQADTLTIQARPFQIIDTLLRHINTVKDKTKPDSVRNQAVEQASRLFVEGAEVTQILANGKSRKLLIREYLMRLKYLPIANTRTDIELDYIGKIAQTEQGYYFGELFIKQRFIDTGNGYKVIENEYDGGHVSYGHKIRLTKTQFQEYSKEVSKEDEKKNKKRLDDFRILIDRMTVWPDSVVIKK